MSFFTLSTGSAVEAGTSYEVAGMSQVMPESSIVKAVISKVEWKENFSKTSHDLRITWKVVGEDFKGNSFNQTFAFDDPKKSDKAKIMFATLDKLTSNGAVVAMGKRPTEQEIMQHMANKPVGVKLGVYEIAKDDGGTSVGNFVKKVGLVVEMAKELRDQGGQPQTPVPQSKAGTPVAATAYVAPIDDSNIPF